MFIPHQVVTAADLNALASGGSNLLVDVRATPNGALPYPLTGHGDTGGAPIISNGAISRETTVGGYAYAQVGPSDSRISHFVVGFRKTPETVGGGSFCVALMETDFIAQHIAGGGVPRSPFHLLMNRNDLWVTGYATSGGSPTSISPVYSRLKALGDNTAYWLEVVLDIDAGTAYIIDPSGVIWSFSNSIIKDVPAFYAFVEDVKDNADPPTGKAIYETMFFSPGTHSDLRIAEVKQLYALQNRQKAVTADLTAGTTALTTTPSALAGGTLTFTWPDVQNIRITAEVFIDVTVAGTVNLGIFDSTNALIAYSTVATTVGGRMVLASFTFNNVYLGKGPGDSTTLKLVGYTANSATASVKVGSGGGSISYPSKIRMMPEVL